VNRLDSGGALGFLRHGATFAAGNERDPGAAHFWGWLA
jgi:hypothetical protein